MNDPRLTFEVHRYKAVSDWVRQKILADDPENLDEQTIADTTEGLTDLHEMLAEIVRSVLEDETRVSFHNVRIKEISNLLQRFHNRADRRRETVREAMLKADVKTITKEDFTVSLRNAPPHVVVVDETLIPQTFFEMRPHLRKRDLLNALKDGAQFDGAVLSNPGLSLTVRTR